MYVLYQISLVCFSSDVLISVPETTRYLTCHSEQSEESLTEDRIRGL